MGSRRCFNDSAFDVTPADLVTGIITEKGVIFSPSKEKIDSLFISD